MFRMFIVIGKSCCIGSFSFSFFFHQHTHNLSPSLSLPVSLSSPSSLGQPPSTIPTKEHHLRSSPTSFQPPFSGQLIGNVFKALDAFAIVLKVKTELSSQISLWDPLGFVIIWLSLSSRPMQLKRAFNLQVFRVCWRSTSFLKIQQRRKDKVAIEESFQENK